MVWYCGVPSLSKQNVCRDPIEWKSAILYWFQCCCRSIRAGTSRKNKIRHVFHSIHHGLIRVLCWHPRAVCRSDLLSVGEWAHEDTHIHTHAHTLQLPFKKAAYIHRKVIAWKDAVRKKEEMNKVVRVGLREVETAECLKSVGQREEPGPVVWYSSASVGVEGEWREWDGWRRRRMGKTGVMWRKRKEWYLKRVKKRDVEERKRHERKMPKK